MVSWFEENTAVLWENATFKFCMQLLMEYWKTVHWIEMRIDSTVFTNCLSTKVLYSNIFYIDLIPPLLISSCYICMIGLYDRFASYAQICLRLNHSLCLGSSCTILQLVIISIVSFFSMITESSEVKCRMFKICSCSKL